MNCSLPCVVSITKIPPLFSFVCHFIRSPPRKPAIAIIKIANMTVLGCKVRRDRAEQFKAACKKNGTSPNAIFMAAMEKFMEEHGEVRENSEL